jgi:hypothetical protein
MCQFDVTDVICFAAALRYRGLGYLGRIAVIGNAGDAMLENQQLGASAGAIARSGYCASSGSMCGSSEAGTLPSNWAFNVGEQSD